MIEIPEKITSPLSGSTAESINSRVRGALSNQNLQDLNGVTNYRTFLPKGHMIPVRRLRAGTVSRTVQQCRRCLRTGIHRFRQTHTAIRRRQFRALLRPVRVRNLQYPPEERSRISCFRTLRVRCRRDRNHRLIPWEGCCIRSVPVSDGT